MTDADNFEYVITDFDTVNRVVKVEFAEGGWAAVPLVAPLPTSLAELDKLVRHFCAPKEALAARADTETDLSFITGNMLTPRTAGRLSLHAPNEVVVPEQAPPATVEEAKARKLEEIAQWRYRRETGGVDVGGVTVATDTDSQSKLTGAFLGLTQGILTTVDWKGSDGTFTTLGLPEVTAVATAVSAHVQQSFSLEKSLAAQARAATTIEEVMAIVPETIYPVGPMG